MRIAIQLFCYMIIWIALCCGQAAADAGDVNATDEWAAMAGKPVSRLVIDISGPEKNVSEWIEMASTLINITEGAPFSPDQFQKALNGLKKCGRFAKVNAEPKRIGETVQLAFYLTAKRVIRDIVIEIKGRDGVFKKDILRVMTVYPGSSWSSGDLDAQKTAVEEMLKARGFPAPVVEIRPVVDTGNYTLVLQLNISLGHWLPVRAVHLSGNRAFSDMSLKFRMKTWRACVLPWGTGRFVQWRLDHDIESLVKFYRKKGFAEVAAAYSLNSDPVDGGMSIEVGVTEGPRYAIEFQGNDRFSGRTLKKELVLFSRGNVSGLGIRKSVKKMKERYLQAGYREVDIAVEESLRQTEQDLCRKIRFVIDEGPRTIVRSLEVRGNNAVPDEKIYRQVLTSPRSRVHDGAYLPQILDEDVQAIGRLYRQNGFYHVQVEKDVSFNEDDTEANILIRIDEGVSVHVSSVSFEGLQSISNEKALEAIRLKPPALFDDESVGLDEINLATLISEKGYPHVKVESAVIIDAGGRSADIVYRVEEGPLVRMGEVYLSGNLRTRENVVRQELEMTVGEPFSLTRMVKSQQNLRSQDIFRAVNFTPVGLQDQDERVHLFIETIEKNPFFIELSGGYNSEQGGAGKVAAGDHNLLGSNRGGYVSWEVSEIGYRGNLDFRSPRFFSTRATSLLSVYLEKTEAFNQNFGVKTRGASFGINRHWTRSFSAGINVNTERRRQYPLNAEDSGEEAYETRNTVTLTPGLVYDTRDNGLTPTRGVLASCDVTVSEGINSNLDDFFKYQGSVRYYHDFFDTVTMALIGRAGYIDPVAASEAVSADQLFYLGGISSVRGYAENRLVFDSAEEPVGGRLSLCGSVEVRVAVKRSFSLILFYDVGKLGRTYSSDDLRIRSALGVGLGYQTPIGPVSLYYGAKLDRRDGEDAGRIHFSIGYTF